VVKIIHGRNGREFKVPELPHFSVDGYGPEIRTIYEFFGCHWHGRTCQPVRYDTTLHGDALAERYDRTMSNMEQMTREGYLVKFQLESEFADAGRAELLAQSLVQKSKLRNRDALYGGRTEVMRLHYKARENETIQHVDIISLYPYLCKYFKFPVGQPTIHVACQRMDGLIKCSIVPPEKLYHPLSLSDLIINSCFACVERSFCQRQVRDACIPEMRILPSPVRV